MAANNHQSVFSLANCDYRLHSYQNSGFSPGWRFDDAVAFDWLKKQIHYQGLTQGPKTPDAQRQAVTLPLDDAIYVDKLSQFAALACALGENGKSTQIRTQPNTKQSVPLSYVDDTIGRYRFSVAQATTQMSVAGQTITVIKVAVRALRICERQCASAGELLAGTFIRVLAGEDFNQIKRHEVDGKNAENLWAAVCQIVKG